MLKQLKQRNQGFTIVETLIVLGIAGMIMLVVFLAVPSLQRNQRNTARRTDASRIAAAANEFVTNNSSGTLPSTTVHSGAILTTAGNLSGFGTITAQAADAVPCAIGSFATGRLTICTSATVTFTAPAAGQEGLILATGAQCNGSGAISTGSARQMAVLYSQETSGAPTFGCLNI